MSEPRYAELQVTTHFSFLRGASSCEELFSHAAALGIEALAVVDRNSLAGIVRAHETAKATGVRLVVGCRLDLADAPPILVYPTDRPAYSRLCRLLSLGKQRAGKAKCDLRWSDLVAYGDGLIAVLVPDMADEDCGFHLSRLRDAFGDRAYMALTLRRRPNDQLRLHDLSNLAARMRVETVVTNDILFHEPSRRVLQDVVTCIRHGVTIDDLGERRERHADRYLKPPAEMHRLFGRYPEALARTLEIVRRCSFSMDELRYQYPEERDDPSLTPQQTLERRCRLGSRQSGHDSRMIWCHQAVMGCQRRVPLPISPAELALSYVLELRCVAWPGQEAVRLAESMPGNAISLMKYLVRGP